MDKNTIYNNVDLKSFNSWKVGGRAEQFLICDDKAILSSLIKTKKIKLPITFLGLGSNLLVRDGGVKGTVIVLHGGLKKINHDEDNLIYSEAGVSCSKLAKFTAGKGLGNSAFFSGIPGTVGGALAMNAGAFKQSIWDSVDSVNIVNNAGDIKNISCKKVKTSYRHVDKNNILLFLDVLLVINKRKVFDVNILREYSEHRSITQPVKQWSSGCIFKNPSKNTPASSLIDSLDIKKRKIGGIYISKKHCNYFINDGSGSCKDLTRLIEYVSKLVKKKYNISLMREICIY